MAARDAMGSKLFRRGFSDQNLYIAFNSAPKVTPISVRLRFHAVQLQCSTTYYYCFRNYWKLLWIWHVTIGTISLCIGKSRCCLHNTPSKSDWLCSTQSRVLLADRLMGVQPWATCTMIIRGHVYVSNVKLSSLIKSILFCWWFWMLMKNKEKVSGTIFRLPKN